MNYCRKHAPQACHYGRVNSQHCLLGSWFCQCPQPETARNTRGTGQVGSYRGSDREHTGRGARGVRKDLGWKRAPLWIGCLHLRGAFDINQRWWLFIKWSPQCIRISLAFTFYFPDPIQVPRTLNCHIPSGYSGCDSFPDCPTFWWPWQFWGAFVRYL